MKTATRPAAPKISRLVVLGIRNSVPADIRIPPVSATSDHVYITMHAVSTNGTKPRSRPSRRSAGPNPHKPGFQRPHVKQRSSFTPTRLLHDGQTTDPHFCRNM